MQYELFYLVAGSKEAALAKIKEAAQKIVTEEGGVFEPKVTQEKRKLAYQIKHETHGFYIAQRFNLEDTEKTRTISRKLNLSPEILRFLITRADELPELKTKEERIEAANQIVKREREIATKKIAPVEAPTEILKEKPGRTKKAGEEDIDKKLEEILNI